MHMLNRGFTLVELVIVVLILGILASVVLPKAFLQTSDSELATIRLSLRAMQDQIDLQHALTGQYPARIEATWFRGNKLPHHPLNGGSIPDVHVFNGDNRQHPSHKTLDLYGAYWYNPVVGVVRARVPVSPSAAQIIAQYNEVNQAALTTLNQMYD